MGQTIVERVRIVDEIKDSQYMYELCKKKDLIHPHKLIAISTLYGGLPFDKLPDAKSGQVLICAYDQWGIDDGENARLIVCKTKEDIQSLYDSYSRGGAMDIKWYLAPTPQFIMNPNKPDYTLISLTPLKELEVEDPDTFTFVISKLSDVVRRNIHGAKL